MKHGIWLWNAGGIDAAQLVELGVAAEEAGWDGVFVSDSLPYEQYPDPFVVLAGIAARTTDVTLGTWVVPLPRRQPWQVAQEVATLDRLSGGRVLLGAGLGNDPDYDAFGTPYDTRTLAARLDESLDVITGLWSGEPFSYDGEHFSLDAAEVHPTPVQEPRVPIVLAGWWPNRKPLRRGARWDGIMPFFASLTGDGEGPHGERPSGDPEDEVRDALQYYHDVADDPDDPGEIVVPTVPIVDDATFARTVEDLGATWLLTTDVGESYDEAEAVVRDGPPA